MLGADTPGARVAELEGFEELVGADRLQRIPIFHGLSYEETNALALLVRSQHAKPAQVLVEQSALGSALYLVTQGQVRVERLRDPEDKRPDAQREVLGHLGEGEMFGEMSLVDDMLTSARVLAEGEVELLVIDRVPFEKLLAAKPTLALKIYKAFCRQLSERLRKTNELLVGKAGLLAHTS